MPTLMWVFLGGVAVYGLVAGYAIWLSVSTYASVMEITAISAWNCYGKKQVARSSAERAE